MLPNKISEFWVLSSEFWFNSLRPRQDGRLFPDIFKSIFFNENVQILIKISLTFVPKAPINNIPALVQIMAWRRPGDKPLSKPMMVSLLTHICVTWPQWVNSRRPSDAYICQLTVPSLVQIMGCRLFGDTPLSEPMMVYCQFDPKERVSMKFHLNFKSFHSRKCIWRCRLQKWWTSCLSLNVLNQELVHSSPTRLELLHGPSSTRFAISQWETALLCNGVSHWLGANLESALMYIYQTRTCHHHHTCRLT